MAKRVTDIPSPLWLNEDCQLAHELLTLLQEEQIVLTTRDAKRLQEISHEKISRLQSLEQHQRQRLTVLQTQHFPATYTGMRHYLQKALNDEDLQEAEEKLANLKQNLHQIHQQNLINGMLIAANTQVNKRLERLLLNTPNTGVELYSKQGNAQVKHIKGDIDEV